MFKQSLYIFNFSHGFCKFSSEKALLKTYVKHINAELRRDVDVFTLWVSVESTYEHSWYICRWKSC